MLFNRLPPFFPRATSHAPRFRPICEELEGRIVPTTLVPGFVERPFASGLTQPTAMEFAPDGRLFVAEKGGTVRVITSNGTLLPTPFLTVAVNTFSERGLDGITFDPNFASNHFVYIYYTTNASTPVNRVSRFTVSTTDPNVAQAGSEKVLLDNIPSTNGNHNGGALHFGIDGKLYIGVGESGVPSNAQMLNTLAGKILRINADGSIPSNNPFVNTPGARGEIWALGFRNPFTFAVQPGTGRIFVNDVGEGSWEEIDDLVKGGNYGWNTTEG
ncbi:MAG TPA: PQQ-dependent sugar dehydrogenase, partial [Gemmataceae bacterium]|nr:PQQ-dependent sugar dehydrogenase [Gemmataceae bacterium]